MRKQRATFEKADKAAADGDRVVVDFKGTLDGVAFEGGTAKDYAFALGQGRMLPEFENAIRGNAVVFMDPRGVGMSEGDAHYFGAQDASDNYLV